MQRITDINDKRLDDFRNIKGSSKALARRGLFVAESRIVCENLFSSPLATKAVLICEKMLNKVEAQAAAAEIYLAEKSLLDRVAGFKLHDGILALGEIPENKPLDMLGERCVALCGLINSENVGAIVRNCAAFGFRSIIVDSKTSSPFLRRAVRASMGAVFRTNIRGCDNLVEDLLQLNKSGFGIYSAENCVNSIELSKVDFPRKCVLVVGSEANGIDENILDISDAVVRIPIKAEVGSINAAAATAIFLYEISRNQIKFK